MTADAQLDLPIPTEFFSSAERRGEFAGERLLTQNPRKYHSIVHCSVEGLGMIRIGRLLKVSPNMVMAVRDREGEAVDIEKKRLSNLYRKGAALAVYLNSLPDTTTSMGKPGEREKQKGLESVSSEPDPDHRDQDDQGGIRFAGQGPH